LSIRELYVDVSHPGEGEPRLLWSEKGWEVQTEELNDFVSFFDPSRTQAQLTSLRNEQLAIFKNAGKICGEVFVTYREIEAVFGPSTVQFIPKVADHALNHANPFCFKNVSRPDISACHQRQSNGVRREFEPSASGQVRDMSQHLFECH
jgi:hypothetical protein